MRDHSASGAPRYRASFKCVLQAGEGRGSRSAEVPIVGERRVEADGAAGRSGCQTLSVEFSGDSGAFFPPSARSGRVCLLSVGEGSLSLSPLTFPGGPVASSFPPFLPSAFSAFSGPASSKPPRTHSMQRKASDFLCLQLMPRSHPAGFRLACSLSYLTNYSTVLFRAD